MSAASEPLLEVRGLRTWVGGRAGIVRAVDGASFRMARGESLALVGESGSGKSMTCHTLVRLEPRPAARIVSGEVIFEGEDLLKRPLSAMVPIRGRRIGLILQDPLGSLNPVLTIGAQLGEALLLSEPGASRAAIADRCAAALERVGINEARRRLAQFPFEFSGGMRQRVCAAIAVAREPALLIADEPTTALDVTTQAVFLELLASLRRELGMALLLVTHDLGIVNRACERVAVMYAGRVVETGPTREVIASPRHPYTQALLRAIPHLDGPRLRRMNPIPGEPPSHGAPERGCRFAPRCAFAQARCREDSPPTVTFEGGDSVACWLHVPAGTAP